MSRSLQPSLGMNEIALRQLIRSWNQYDLDNCLCISFTAQDWYVVILYCRSSNNTKHKSSASYHNPLLSIASLNNKTRGDQRRKLVLTKCDFREYLRQLVWQKLSSDTFRRPPRRLWIWGSYTAKSFRSCINEPVSCLLKGKSSFHVIHRRPWNSLVPIYIWKYYNHTSAH